MITSYNENSRVKIPALVHFARLGYQYVSLKDYQGKIDADTNIFIDTFLSAINRINHTSLLITDAEKIIAELKIALAADDLGRSFFSYLLAGFCDLKLIDLEPENYQNNIFQIVTELTYRSGNDEFRPDITVLINGLPLAFVEVKKPNNKDGIQAEYTRMNIRAQNKKFRKFINITQLMIFSNNSEYDDNEATPLEGAFYATSGYEKLFFSHFREEDETIFSRISALDSETEDFILCDNNLVSLKNTLEYKTNLLPLTPTNRIITSLFSRNRLMLILKYAFAYVEWTDDNGIRHLEKHVMRYPQFFATLAIEQKLRSGVKKGIIWHTQGSGKTALAYFNVHYLRDFFQKQRVIAKFYFVVDRLDLLTQAADEFRSRGLIVIEVNSKEDFISNIRMIGDPGPTGQITITVVNIQKFSEESVAGISDYNVSVQRVYFLDEAHRSYKPYGSFLSNLIASDRDAIMIALTGTPLIGEGYNTKDVFGAYIHKYYYNRSIADRYTLRLIREGIATTYRKSLESALDSISTLRGSLSRKEMYAHPKYVNELVKYITEDFGKSRLMLGDPTIGGMIVCDSSEQARTAFEAMEKTPYSSALILHDEGDTETRRKQRNDFEKGRIDFLIVYNMLLTGFNAPRLKKLYLGRVIKDHSLLQALTRVNRPYGKQQFGYIVDFADIRAEFDKTNKAYFDELQSELGDAFEQYNNIFMSEEEIEQNLEAITEKLFLYDTTNVEVFSQQISVLDDKSELLEIRHALELYKELFNLARLFGYDQLASRFTLEKIIALYHEICNRIALVNLKESLQSSDNMSAILNLALNEIEFHFKKVSESEMVIADKFRESLERTRGEMQHTLDPKDPEYITLLEELRRLLGKKHIEELTAEEMTDYISELERIRTAAARRNHSDQMLAAKYDNDPKFMRTHKRLRETPPPLASDPVIHRVLLSLKHRVDQIVLSNQHLLDNEPYFMRDMLPLVKQALTENKVHYTASQIRFISSCISDEYFSERNWAS